MPLVNFITFLHTGSEVLLQPADKLAGVAIQYSTIKYNKNVCKLALLILFIPNKVPIFFFLSHILATVLEKKLISETYKFSTEAAGGVMEPVPAGLSADGLCVFVTFQRESSLKRCP